MLDDESGWYCWEEADDGVNQPDLDSRIVVNLKSWYPCWLENWLMKRAIKIAIKIAIEGKKHD